MNFELDVAVHTATPADSTITMPCGFAGGQPHSELPTNTAANHTALEGVAP